MAMSLRPAVSGATRRSIQRVTLLHSAGLAMGAILMALVMSLVRSAALAAGLSAGLAIPAGVALAIAVLQSLGMTLPQRRWQVPEYWRRTIDAGVLPVAYGAILGFGVFTAVVVGAFWVFVAATLLFTLPTALLGWLAYALGRAIGFRLSVQEARLDRIVLTPTHRRLLVLATTGLAAIVLIS